MAVFVKGLKSGPTKTVPGQVLCSIKVHILNIMLEDSLQDDTIGTLSQGNTGIFITDLVSVRFPSAGLTCKLTS